MANEQKLSASEISELRERWITGDGVKVRQALLAALRGRKLNWSELLHDLPTVSIPAPYPDVLDDLRGLCLSHELLDGISLTFSDLSYSTFHSCSMKKIRLQGSKLSWASFKGSNLLQADLLQVSADHVVFDNCKLAGAMMMAGDYKGGSFKRTDLRKCVLNGGDFSGGDFSSVKLQGVEIYHIKSSRSLDLSLRTINLDLPEP